MNDYYKQDKKKKLKGSLTKVFIFLLVFLILILSYILYEKTQVTESNLTRQNVTAERTMQTLDEVKANNGTVTEMIAEINNSVVGISKVKNSGSGIFSDENISSLGLGTGLIVGENGYILTNAHVSGEKYSKCYVTLANGKTYDGNVVWSNTDIDMAIVQINQKKLQVATLGDSDDIKVGETVYAIGNPIASSSTISDAASGNTIRSAKSGLGVFIIPVPFLIRETSDHTDVYKRQLWFWPPCACS